MADKPPVIKIEHATKFNGQTVTLEAWLHNLRRSGKLLFPIFRDGTGFMQGVVVKAAVEPEIFDRCRHLTQESSVRVTGNLRAEERAPGGFEIEVSGVEVLQAVDAEEPFPITPKEHGVEFLMDHRHLWLRSRGQHAVLRVRHAVIRAVRDFLDNNGFTLVDTPILTPAACEGTTTLFEVPYFDEGTAYLAQSGQLYNEATAAAFGKTYCFGPTFRAEKSKTRRHLTEFWMVEPEMAYAELDDVMTLAEDMIVYVVETRARYPATRAANAGARRFQARIRAHTVSAHQLRRCGRGTEKEGKQNRVGRRLRRYGRNAGQRGLRPPGCRAPIPDGDQGLLYAAGSGASRVGARRRRARSEGYGELVGGGQRIHDYNLLVQKLEEHKLPREAFEWYLDLRRYGSVPHGGFGMGIERCVAWLCGIEHVRETIAFPRMLYRMRP